jgi:hypothetical protein
LRRSSHSGNRTGFPANFPRGWLGKKKVLYVSVVATVYPIAPTVPCAGVAPSRKSR